MRYRREYPCKGRKWIEHSSEIREWREEKCRDDIYLIEILGIESIDKSKKRKKECNEKKDKKRKESMLEHTRKEKKRDDIDDSCYHTATYNSAECISGDDRRRMHWCDEKFFDRFLEFCSEK